jgi:peptide chain release factor 1
VSAAAEEEFASVAPLVAEHADLERQLADPELHADAGRARKVGRRYAELGQIVGAWETYKQYRDDLAAARELATEDPAFAAEIPDLELAETAASDRLRSLLIPRDPDDGRDMILEIKAGEGGEESALFAADLLRMYIHYAESKRWKTELLERTESDLGGFKDVQLAIKGSSNDPAEGVWAHLKYEGGVHRVQRVPKTEAQGRIHTSAVGVLVFPEVDAPEEVTIDPNDLKIDVFRSSGPGGQSVNTTDSAVRITHLPTGIVVSMQNEKSQLQNREAGLRVLRARLLAAQQEAAEAEASAARRSQVRSVDRSERIRTYNYPENRISDHRTGYKAYNLDQVLDGALEPIVRSAIEADEAARLRALAEA